MYSQYPDILMNYIHRWQLHYSVITTLVQDKTLIHKLLTIALEKKAIPLQAWTGPYDSRKLRLPEFLNNWHTRLARLSASCTCHLFPPGDICGTHFCKRLSQAQDHNGPRSIMSMKNSIVPIRNRTSDLLTCSTVPQPTASLQMQSPMVYKKNKLFLHHQNIPDVNEKLRQLCNSSNCILNKPFTSFPFNQLPVIKQFNAYL
jgi:hypothetical protein